MCGSGREFGAAGADGAWEESFDAPFEESFELSFIAFHASERPIQSRRAPVGFVNVQRHSAVEAYAEAFVILKAKATQVEAESALPASADDYAGGRNC